MDLEATVLETTTLETTALENTTLENTVTELAPALLRYCLGRTACPQLAEEVAQDALSALVDRWRRHGPPRNPAAFAFAIARRRAGRANFRRALLNPLEMVSELAGREPDPADLAERRAELVEVRRALAHLAPKDREVLLLVAVAELDQRTIAATLGISRSAVKMRLHRARKRLTELMEVAHEPAC